MKIASIEYFTLDMPLVVPYTIAYETVSKTTNVILKLNTDSRLTGWALLGSEDVVLFVVVELLTLRFT